MRGLRALRFTERNPALAKTCGGPLEIIFEHLVRSLKHVHILVKCLHFLLAIPHTGIHDSGLLVESLSEQLKLFLESLGLLK